MSVTMRTLGDLAPGGMLKGAMNTPEDNPKDLRIADLEREVAYRGKRIEELKAEIDLQRKLVAEFEERSRESDKFLEGFIAVFGLVLNDDGKWTNSEFLRDHDTLIDRHNDLLRRHNKLIDRFNLATGHLRPRGRPITATAAQQALILKRHKAAQSSRLIAEELTLSRQTVRTVIDNANGAGRAMNKRRAQLGLDPKPKKDWRIAARERMPQSAGKHFEKGRELRQAAKGLR
jgi:hypothetical protein